MLKWKEFVRYWQKMRVFFLLLVAVELFLVILLVGFQSLPFFTSSDADDINQAGLQRVRSQVFVKSALILEYRPLTERMQALSDMQISLPLFEQEQSVLQNNKDVQVQLLLQQARSNYLALVSATQKILSDPASLTHVSTLQVDIILQNNRLYLVPLSSVVAVMQNDADAQMLGRFLVEAVLEVLIVGVTVGAVAFGQHFFKVMLSVLEDGAVKADS